MKNIFFVIIALSSCVKVNAVDLTLEEKKELCFKISEKEFKKEDLEIIEVGDSHCTVLIKSKAEIRDSKVNSHLVTQRTGKVDLVNERFFLVPRR